MKSFNFKSVLLLIVSLFSGSSIIAHSGHGTFDHSILHYIYSYHHLVGLALAIIFVLSAYKIYKRIKA